MIAFNRPRPQYRIGQLVRHRRYAYRGVVVHVDPSCKAPDTWYYGNQTQPSRDQPWYHVLVDGGDRVTYAAQSSLLPDGSGLPVENSLITIFFESFQANGYTRNDRPWEESW